MKCRLGVLGLCGLWALLLNAPAQATVISFTTPFDGHGSGNFVYDDDNGGANRGFTSFLFDFSPALGPDFASVQIEDGVENSSLGPGGSEAEVGYELLSGVPVSAGSRWFVFFAEDLTAPMNVVFGQVGSPGTLSVSGGGLACTTPEAGGGEYAFCALVAPQEFVYGKGRFAPVPEPTTLTLLGLGLAGLGTRRRRKR